MSLTPGDIERHKRHILLKEIGGPGVQKLRAASVSVIGAGAPGGPCALYLAAAGGGHIKLWDVDTVGSDGPEQGLRAGGEGEDKHRRHFAVFERAQRPHQARALRRGDDRGV